MKESMAQLLVGILFFSSSFRGQSQDLENGMKILSADSIFTRSNVSFKQCHASTIHDLGNGNLIASWFAGTHEGNADVGIWVADYQDSKWSVPKLVATGMAQNSISYPCWNPVLFQYPNEKTLYLYYKIGPNPRQWWGMYVYSLDNGTSWSLPNRLTEGILGPIKNKPYALADGTIISPSSTESMDEIWKAHVEITKDNGKSWTVYPINHHDTVEVIQPSILMRDNGVIQVLCRSKENFVMSSFSSDEGRTWSAWERTNLQNPNSATDAIRLKDGTFLIAYNPDMAGHEWWEGRTRLRLAASQDGLNWKDVLVLEDGEQGDEYSYPTIIQSQDGLIHVVYTWNRNNIKHVVIN